MAYTLPDDDVVAIIDAPPTPAASLSPDGQFLVLVHYESHPPVAVLARHYLRLGGVRLDPVLRGRHRTLRLVGLTVVTLANGEHSAVALPDDAIVSVPSWSADGRRFAFTLDGSDGIGVWVVDAATAEASPVQGLRVSDSLTGGQTGGVGPVRWSRDGTTLLALAVPADPPPLPVDPPESPRVDETAGKRTLMATFQDLLETEHDEDVFEALATTEPVRVDPATGARTSLGAPGHDYGIEESPDLEHLLVRRLERPFSFRVPFAYFARRIEVWSANGTLETAIAARPVSDEVPRQGVPTGPRNVGWEERAPASLVWTEALDGGDPVAPAEHRDRIMRAHADTRWEPAECLRFAERSVGWYDLDAAGQLLLVEHSRERRWLTTWFCDLAAPAERRVLFDHSVNDAYAHRGTPLQRRNRDGTVTAIQAGSIIYLRGEGSTPDGDRPFVDRFDLADGSSERLHQSPADALERIIGFVGRDRSEVLVRHESPTQPPNFFVADVEDIAGTRRAVTAFGDPHPQLTGMTKRFVNHDRGDGVELTGKLHLPPGYDPERHGSLPLVLWAYPLDFGDAGTAGQVRGSTQTFTRLSALLPIWFVLRGYAVLADAAMPVIGDPETMNDTYVEQVTAAARAHIDALANEGIVDPTRVIVGGHSYGGFMTANLLAHTDLFAAGIARSGAYNRSLTPFGFQTERRNFWEVPEVYDRLSPFRYADKITAPLLLIHGAEDNNTGTFTVQSERLFQAMQGVGGTARLVLLPHEAHGYMARESVLHVLAEQFAWAERWAPAKPIA